MLVLNTVKITGSHMINVSLLVSIFLRNVFVSLTLGLDSLVIYYSLSNDELTCKNLYSYTNLRDNNTFVLEVYTLKE